MMIKLAVEQSAPDYRFNTLDGEQVALSDIWRAGNHTLLIYTYPQHSCQGCDHLINANGAED